MQFLDRSCRSLTDAIESIDWTMVLLFAGFLAVAPVGTVFEDAVRPFLWVARSATADVEYERALAAAALKRPSYKDAKLETIDPNQPSVNLVSFDPKGRDIALPGRDFDIWAALGSQVRAACAGSADPTRALQQLLGLPLSQAANP